MYVYKVVEIIRGVITRAESRTRLLAKPIVEERSVFCPQDVSEWARTETKKPEHKRGENVALFSCVGLSFSYSGALVVLADWAPTPSATPLFDSLLLLSSLLHSMLSALHSPLSNSFSYTLPLAF